MKAEVFILLLIILIVLVWAIWFRFTTWLYKKRYNPDNDKGKQAEDRRTKGRGEQPPTPTAAESLPGFVPTSEPSVFQAAGVGSDGKDSNSRGETGKRPRGFFGIVRRKA